jgi:hypothetical protein
MYWGVILPYIKSKAFISMLYSFRDVTTVEDFKTLLSRGLDVPSPVGQAEYFRFLSNEILNVIDNRDRPVTGEVAKVLVDYLDEKFMEFTKNGTYTYSSETQQLFIMGQLHYIVGAKYEYLEHLSTAEDYYRKCLEVSPTRPQCLTALQVLYYVTNKDAEANALKEKILSYWPTETLVR